MISKKSKVKLKDGRIAQLAITTQWGEGVAGQLGERRSVGHLQKKNFFPTVV